MIKQIEIFTDGSCLSNPGPGGYGIILRYFYHEISFSTGYLFTTNNRMELMAVVVALESIQEKNYITLITDSQYVYNGITRWISNWKKNNWKNSKNKIIKNYDLWQRLGIAINIHNIKWIWTKSHTGHKENEYCDKLAKLAAANPTEKDLGYMI